MSERRSVHAIRAVALAGFSIAGYLTYVHYAGIEPVCAASGGCELVQSSRYAELRGAPVAVLGLAGYAAVVATTVVHGEAARLAGAGLALAGAGFSLYLSYLELFVIDAVCPWCVASAVLMLALAGLAAARAVSAPGPAPTAGGRPAR